MNNCLLSTTHISSSQSILLKVSQGQVSSFETIFHQYYVALCNHAFTYLKSKELAEDVVSDVFTKMWEKRSNINIETSIKSYLFRAVSNMCIDTLRKAYYKKISFQDTVESTFTSKHTTIYETYTENKELGTYIENAITALPKQCQMIFRLSKELGLKYSEIAQLLNISVKTVEAQMTKAFKTLKASLTQQYTYA
jgi:RNA polymerase sigma-70 factor, ECF subfamily